VADQGTLPRISLGDGSGGGSPLHPARIAAMLGRRDQLFAVGVVVLSAKLAKCDGPVVRTEIDAFKRQFRIPPESVRDIGRLFDQARDSDEAFDPYAKQLGESFADNRGLLEDVLAALFAIARADKAVTAAEEAMLRRVHRAFGLDEVAWDQARGAARMRENHPDSLASRGVPPEFIARAGEKVARINAAWDQIKRERRL